jgi:LPXTG-motif cell wall-anchored protein
VSADFTCTSADNSISCSRPTLKVGEVGTITVTALVPTTAVGGANVVNTATVHTTTAETNLANNTDSATVVPFVVESEAPTIPLIPPTAELPRTGSNVIDMLRLAGLLAVLGAGGIVISRRRKRGEQQDVAS